ncbi:MAG: hypothetical protein GY696_09350 [Gammaproteobacteria bacterium]|nr:hypothetical protein [Gammaproteobacteria bacterium]
MFRQVTGDRFLMSFQVHQLPMEKVRLVWINDALPLASVYTLKRAWTPYTMLSNTLRFNIATETQEACQQLLEELREDPDLFGSLVLEYVIEAQNSERKMITVKGEHLIRGDLYAKLRTGTGNRTTVYLTGEDVNRLSR